MRLALIMFFFSLVLFGCNKTVDIVGGEVPDSLLPYTQTLTGDYAGHFETLPIKLTLALNGNFVTLSADQDLLGLGCNSYIGLLTRVSFKDKKGKEGLTQAVFDFNPRNCSNWVWGHKLYLDFKKDHVEASIFEHQTVFHTCDPYIENHQPHPPYPQPYPPVPHCYDRVIDYYLVGSFSKI